jgi:hypothetical protein
MPNMCLDNEYVQFDAQFAFLTVIFADQSLHIVNTIRHATHNALWNTLQLSNSKHFPTISWKMPILGAQGAHRACIKLICLIYANA